MKLISLNVELNRHKETVLNFLKKEKPDVFCAQELLEDDFEEYKRELGIEGVFQFQTLVTYFHYDEIKGKKQGIGIFAEKIVSTGISYYEENENVRRSLLWADVLDDDGKTMRFTTAHPPVTKEGEVTELQLEVIDSLIEKLQSLGEFIFCGDMNAPRGKESFARFSKKFIDNIPSEYETSIDQNLHRVKGIKFMVDGLFTTPLYKSSNVKLVDGVSDHMAIVAEIESGNYLR